MEPIRIWYSPQQTAARNASFSPSAGKPALVLAAWQHAAQEHGLALEVREPRPTSVDELCLAHERAYVEGVLAGTVPNGFGNTLREVAHTLPWTSGSLRSAAEDAVATGASTFSPTSGFHHAGYASGGGFCTFNGLMVTALSLQRSSLVERVAILDLDRHYGDGTEEIIERAGAEWVRHYTFGAEGVQPATAEHWLERLPEIVACTVADCQVALYQAGADPHADDPLGGILTTEQLARRDRIVYEQCLAARVPVVTNLAGGYQQPVERVVALHVGTLLEFVRVAASER